MLKVYPLTGLVDGGIRVTIKGLNLGTNFDQVRQSVTVAGVSCEVLASEYIVSRQ
jgi:IPT/TIG domain